MARIVTRQGVVAKRTGSRLTAEYLTEKSAEYARAVALRTSEVVKFNAPVRTRAMQKSVHARKGSGNNWMVRVGKIYGIYVNYGTRYMRAQPFFTEGVEQVRGEMPEIARKVWNGETNG